MLEVRRIHRSCNRHMPRLRISGIHADRNAVFFGKTGGNEKVAEPLAGSQYRPSAAMAEGRFCVWLDGGAIWLLQGGLLRLGGLIRK